MDETKTHKQHCVDKYGSTKFKTDFSEEIWASTYKDSKDETIDDTFYRVAKAVASVEKTEDSRTFWTEQFYDLLTDFKFTAGGRIYSNAGTDWSGTTLMNCFTAVKPTYDLDSLDGIMETLKYQAQTLKSEGGWGMNFSFIRPRGGFIHGIGVETPGAVTYMEIFNKSSDIITQGSGRKSKNKSAKGKIRKGAMMSILDCTHPDIEEFITAKLTEGRLDKFNISVNCSDEFVEKVIKVKELKEQGVAYKKEDEWNLEFPDTTHEMYKQEWNGDLKYWKSLGYPVVVYKTVSALALWDQIMKSTYTRNDPGVLFLDKANYTYCYNYGGKDWVIRETNPCSEQVIPPSGACNLGSCNLTQFVNSNTNQFDLDKLSKYTEIATRFLDNVNDLTNAPLPEYVETIREKRRVGLGIMGWGSALYMMKTKFASREAENIKHLLMKTFVQAATKASIELAKEKGMFVGCIPEKHANHIFWKQTELDCRLLDEMRKHGVRNSSLFSIQPTGNTSIVANITSGGLEPVFMPEYIRTVIVPNCPDELLEIVPKYWMGEFHETDVFKLSKEGNDTILVGEVNGIKYKIDKNRGLTKEQLCSDYGVRYLKDSGEWDEKASWACTTTNLSADEHLIDMKGFGKWIDASMSKTINLPNDYLFEDFENIYLDAWKTGYLKGTTTYRAGTMATVLKSTNETNSLVKINKTTAPKRPKELPCDINHTTVEGEKWVVFVGLLEGEPYEIFGGLAKYVEIPKKHKTGIIKKNKVTANKSVYDLHVGEGEDELVIKNVSDTFKDDNNAWATRMISLALRHGSDVTFVVEQLTRDTGASFHSFSKVIGRVLKKYIVDGAKSSENCPECENKLVFQEGCVTCMNCGFTKCA